jgi:hypothetical protein
VNGQEPECELLAVYELARNLTFYVVILGGIDTQNLRGRGALEPVKDGTRHTEEMLECLLIASADCEAPSPNVLPHTLPGRPGLVWVDRRFGGQSHLRSQY